MNAKHVIVADDEKEMRHFVCWALLRRGYRTTEVTSGEEALSKCSDPLNAVDALVTDYDMPGISGLEVVEELRSRGITIPAIVMSRNDEEDLPRKLELLNNTAFIRKPFVPDSLVELMESQFHCAVIA
ncbi:response regulator [Candidatus Hydrogenedentota bacterium]